MECRKTPSDCCTTHLQTKKLLKSSVTVVFLIFLVFSDLLSFFRHRTRIRFHPFLSASTHADVSRSCYFKAQHLQLLQAEFLGDPPRRYSSAKHSEVVQIAHTESDGKFLDCSKHYGYTLLKFAAERSG